MDKTINKHVENLNEQQLGFYNQAKAMAGEFERYTGAKSHNLQQSYARVMAGITLVDSFGDPSMLEQGINGAMDSYKLMAKRNSDKRRKVALSLYGYR